MKKIKRTTTVKIHRDAVTGRFVTQEYVDKNPRTTVTETRPKPRKGK